MKASMPVILAGLTSVPLVLALTTTKPAKPAEPAAPTAAERVTRGRYLVNFGGCNDCHTPMKFGPNGPEPDFSRLLSGHPADANLPPPPKLEAGPWFAVTAGMTAWSGPWGISYAANLTPDETTGIGIWTEDVFIRTIRNGRHFAIGRELLPPMPSQNVAQLTDEDLKSMLAYLKSIPPVRNRVPEPVPPGGSASFE